MGEQWWKFCQSQQGQGQTHVMSCHVTYDVMSMSVNFGPLVLIMNVMRPMRHAFPESRLDWQEEPRKLGGQEKESDAAAHASHRPAVFCLKWARGFEGDSHSDSEDED